MNTTREVASIMRPRTSPEEISRSPAAPGNGVRRKELDEAVAGCEILLRVMDEVLRKFNALGDDRRGKGCGRKSNSVTASRRTCRTSCLHIQQQS